MKVLLLNYFQTGGLASNEKLADVAAAMCVGKYTEAANQLECKNLLPAINSGHDSVLEHLPLTWVIEDVSRALTHQLIRHRIASYSQLSQRYTKVQTDEEWFVKPNSIKYSTYRLKYQELMENTAKLYNAMCEGGIPNEDARMVLPNACFTSIIVSMNARSFSEAATLRTCNRAQWEIRQMFKLMRDSIKDVYPHVWKKCFPNCTKKCGCLEAKPCGNPYEKFSNNK